jgi:lipopolysaccharide biosynthesis glycosyltransferase
MKTALCFTPDLSFFRPAVFTAASLIGQGDADAFDIFIVCEPADVAPGFERLDPALRRKIHLLEVDFSAFARGLAGKGRFSKAVFRRLFLDLILPESYPRLIAIDADMRIARPGLGRLAEIDLAGCPLAAAYDMIYLMDFRGGALAERFQTYRRSLGLDLETPYFNAGLMVIDRATWRARDLGPRAAHALRETPERYAFMEQSALNSLIAGGFAPLSPRCNFMGDFFLLDLETKIAPIVQHFVNSPKPWQFDLWRGEARFALDYAGWFANSPWPDWPSPLRPERYRTRRPPLTATRRGFAERLTAFLSTRRFADLAASAGESGRMPSAPLGDGEAGRS